MKPDLIPWAEVIDGRAPRGARGLKLYGVAVKPTTMASRPARGAWIETYDTYAWDINDKSRPARGAWIETFHVSCFKQPEHVAPRAGRVD